MQSFAGPVLTVSHDRYFLDKVATKILAFEDGKIRPFFGHYTDYLDEKAFETEMANQVQKAERRKWSRFGRQETYDLPRKAGGQALKEY